jgi:hypothetical protein
VSYVEDRVRVSEYGSLPGDSPLLVAVPTAPGRAPQRLHVLVSRDLALMSAAAMADEISAGPLRVASGWRPRRWTSREAYEAELFRRYVARVRKQLGREPTREQVIAHGRRYLAHASPHETGLALDFLCGGLAPVSSTIAKQRATPLHQWLVARAWEWDFTPYKAEPWHWEHRLPMPSYLSGEAA